MRAPGPYAEGTDWPGAGWALAVWAAHFSVSWAASSVFPAQPAARWIALAATALALAALLGVWRWRGRGGGSPTLAAACGVAGLAILFGGMPALVG